MQFKGSFFLTASRTASCLKPDGGATLPAVSLLQTLPEGGSLQIGTIASAALSEYWATRPPPESGVSITELRLDEAATPTNPDDATATATTVRLAVFISIGQWSIFHLSLPSATRSFSYRELHAATTLSTPATAFAYVSPPPRFPHTAAPPAFDPVTLARFHGPLLATCSRNSVLRFWHVADLPGGEIEVRQVDPAMQTYEAYQPVVLQVEPLDEPATDSAESSHHYWPARSSSQEGRAPKAAEPRTLRVSMAYATPVFPSAWTIGLQEFDIQLPPVPLPGKSVCDAPWPRIVKARHATARAPEGTEHSLVTALEYSAPFLVASRNHNTIDVFEVGRAGEPGEPAADPASRQGKSTFARRAGSTLTPHPPPAPSSQALPPGPLARPHRLATPALSLTHLRTLFGHTGSVNSVALLDGKCVSGGADGQVKVWDLHGLTPGREARQERKGREMVTVEETGEEVWVAGGVSERPSGISRVWFDEEQVVVVEGEGVRLLRFD